MSFKPTEFSRRMFLRGLGATVAVAVAHASAEPFLHLNPLEVAAFVDGPDGVAALICVLQSTTVDLRTVLTSSTIVREEADRLITSKGRDVAVFDASVRRRDMNQLPSALLVLGRWESPGEKLLPLSFIGKDIYIDDPLLAKRLAKTIDLPSSPKSSLIGLTSVLDPAVAHTAQRLRSDVMGEVSALAVSTRCGDLIGPLEAAIALQQLVQGQLDIKPRQIKTRNVRPAVHISCARGQLVVPLYSEKERLQTLPFRLEHFVAVARGEVESAISLNDIASLPD